MYKRKILFEIKKYLNTDDVIVIVGARQVGKTTLIKYILEEEIKENYLYIDLERLDMLNLCEKGPEELYNYVIGLGLNENKKITLAIDEIQYLSNPTNLIKLIHDHYKNIKLIVSGSSTFEIKEKFKDSLVGRTVNFTLYPLDFEEFLLFKNKNYIINEKTQNHLALELIELYKEFITYGGYPKIVLSSNIEHKKMYINQIIATYIQKDIKDIGKIRDLNSFNKLVHILASQTSNLLDIADISNTINIDRKTVEKYIFLLEQTFIIKLCYPFHKNLRIELSKTPKIYFIDNGILQILSRNDFIKVLDGKIFENSLFAELLKNNIQCNYWRTTNKQEIDFILNQKFPVEVKLNFSKAKSSAINYFENKYKVKGIFCCLFGQKIKNSYYPWEILIKFGSFSIQIQKNI